jgi:hypothetical protein
MAPIPSSPSGTIGPGPRTSFTAPRKDGTALVVPPFSEVGGMVAANLAERARFQYDFQGRRLSELAEQARRELLAEARRWTAVYRETELSSEDPRGPVFLAGHQPELFHPGVWFKNFALGVLARLHGAAAVNLVIDSDTAKTAALRTPGGSASDPRTQMVHFDQPGPLVPYEERLIVDERTFADFGQRVAECIAPLVPCPLVSEYWPMVLERARHGKNLGHCLAQARHQLEGRWGLQTLEIPQSWVCGCESFSWLVAHLVAQSPRFRETYNQAVHEYRLAHGIRSTAHPVPDLAQDGPWVESPLWVWTTGDPQRRRLFVRQTGRETVLSDRHALDIRLPLTTDGDAAAAVAQLMEVGRRGVKIRSRALVTTLWARLALGDLFLHGIGGAKYDHVTDVLMDRFFGIRPPGIMVLSATLLLPIARQRPALDQARAIRGDLRELAYHPEKFIGEPRASDAMGREKLRELLASKLRWIRTLQTPENAHARWRAFQEINEALQPCVADRRRRLLETQSQIVHALRAENVLAWREYGFCLYPEDSLRRFLEDLLPKNA